jgi:hypothetical protein
MLPRLVIPSYNRPDNVKTLRYLEQIGYPKDKILLFVASQIEHLRYSATCPGIQIHIGVPGLVQQRKFISDFLDESEIYISFDDDVTGIKTLNKSFFDIVKDAVQAIESGRTGLWGILSTDDARRFKDTTTEHLSHIVGAFFICRNHKDLSVKGNSYLEDYERSILYFKKYGTVFRYRGAGVQTRYAGTSVGADNKKEGQEEAAEALAKEYPEFCKTIVKKNGNPDVSLNWRKKISLKEQNVHNLPGLTRECNSGN